MIMVSGSGKWHKKNKLKSITNQYSELDPPPAATAPVADF